MRLFFILFILVAAHGEAAEDPCSALTLEAPIFDTEPVNSDEPLFLAPLTVENIKSSYRAGIFPWTEHGDLFGWWSPSQRGVLDLSELHVPSSLKKEKKRLRREGRYRFAIDENFEEVIRACSLASRPEQEGTWILPAFIDNYTELHRQGSAHSFEIYIDGQLAGGAYGVFIDGVFSGESMFYRVSNAGKLAFWEGMEYLRDRGLKWVDTQTVTEATGLFGAKEISRQEYLERLREAQAKNIPFK